MVLIVSRPGAMKPESRISAATFRTLARMSATALLAVAVSACKIDVVVPVGGSVTTESANYDCKAQSNCTIEVVDTGFSETFVATPAAGYQFIGWGTGQMRLCGGRLGPCAIDTSWFSGYDKLMALLDTDEVTYLEPRFIPVDDIRRYQSGDVISFTGNVTVSNRGEPTRVSGVTVRLEFLPGLEEYEDKQVLTLRSTTTFLETGEQQVVRQSIWQETNGALYELTDTYGNAYVVGSASDQGLLSVPVPLVPFDESTIDFYTLYGGPVSGPVTEGQRIIDVAAMATITTPMGEYPAYPVSHTESYEYFFTYIDNKSGATVRIARDLWVSPAKGLIRKIEVRRDYSRSGVLESETRWELDAKRANF
jgi:hypothetical protein